MSLRMTEDEYAAYIAARRRERIRESAAESKPRRKYGNEPTERDGKRFDSRHEAQVYDRLRLECLAGDMRALRDRWRFTSLAA